MRSQRKAGKAIMVGLFMVAMTGVLFAQQSSDRRQNPANDGQQHAQRAVSHALEMAIGGSDLNFAAQLVMVGNQQGRQGQQTAQQPQGGQGQETAQQQTQQQACQQVVQQIQQQARQQWEISTRMFNGVNDRLNNEGGAATGAEDRNAWSRRLFTAAQQYTTTLRTLSGATGESSSRSQAEGGQAAGLEVAGNLNRTDLARAILINHAVKKALRAFELQQGQANRAFGSSRAEGRGERERERAEGRGDRDQRIQDHTQAMLSDSEQILQRIQDNVNQESGRGTPHAGQQQGGASIQTLAQQAQQVVQTLQRMRSSQTSGASREEGAGGQRQ
jgi:hypothetical protein